MIYKSYFYYPIAVHLLFPLCDLLGVSFLPAVLTYVMALLLCRRGLETDSHFMLTLQSFTVLLLNKIVQKYYQGFLQLYSL